MDVRELFGKKMSETVALIDIGSSSVGGAYALVRPGEPPTLLYTERILIDLKAGKTVVANMLSALDELGKALVEKGAPALRKELGSGQVNTVFATLSSPWQDTQVRVKTIEDPKGFIFSREHLSLSAKESKIPEGHVQSGQFVVAVLLNGYEIGNPFGKRVKRADLVTLSSSIDAEVSGAIQETLKRWYHMHQVELTAFAPLAYDTFRDLYPHEKDFLVFDVSGEATDIAFVKKGLLVDVASIPMGVASVARAAGDPVPTHVHGLNDPVHNSHFAMRVKDAQDAWVGALTKTLTEFSGRHTLPRTIFMLSEENSRDYVKRILDSDSLRRLWLSEEPLRVLPVLPSQFTDYVKTKAAGEGDEFLMMLALAYAKRGTGAFSDPRA